MTGLHTVSIQLICAGLSNHECKVENIQLSNDIIATLNCLKALGVDSRYDETSKTVYIKPSGKKEELFDCLESKEVVESSKSKNTVIKVFAIIGVIAAVAGIAYALYRYFKPDYLEDYEDDFDFDEYEDNYEA